MTLEPKRRIVMAAGLVLATLLTTACSEAEAACGDAFAEKLDPNSSKHLLPGDEAPAYKTDPPTSGAHRAGGITAGVSDVELEEPDQVNILESGDVLLQYTDDVADDDLQELRLMAGEDVVVAPNDSLDTDIVATAWLHKMNCTSFDFDLLQDFVDEYVDAESAPSH